MDENSEEAKEIEKTYTVIKETEKKKYYPNQIVKIMNEEGFKDFTISTHTKLWKNFDCTREKLKNNKYGTYIDSSQKQWMWYDK